MMKHFRPLLVILTLGLSLAGARTGLAQVHAGDVELGVSGGQITVSETLFESDFLPFGPSLLFTDEPGFDSEINTFNSGDMVGFDVTRQLFFWDGTQLTSAAGNPGLMIDFFGQPTVTVDENTTFDPGFNFPTVATGDDGVIHRHLDFSLPSSAPVGAYGLVLQMDSPQYTTSEEFLIVFNNDLGNAQFEAGVDAIEQAAFAVPEPSTYAMWTAGFTLLAIGWGWRKFKRQRLKAPAA